MRVQIFIDTDVVVRHFLQSRAFDRLVERHDVTFVFPGRTHRRLGPVDVEKLDLAGARAIYLEENSARLRLWKLIFYVDRLRGGGMPAAQLASMRQLFRIGNGWKAYLLYRFLGLAGIYQLFQAAINSRLAKTPNGALDTILEAEQPDVIVHPSVLDGIYINDLVEAGNRHDIPVVVIMNSWDNPASKRSVVSNDYSLLVWGQQTRRHALDIMGMSDDHVIVFGAAQFDIYAQAPAQDRTSLLEANGVDPRRPVLLYAGSSKETDEFAHLHRIDQAIESGQLPAMSVIYRPHPWGNGGRDGARFLAHGWKHVVVDIGMRAYLERVAAGDMAKFLPAYADTRDLLAATDAIVSPLSTILIEGMLLGKPGLCFMPVEEEGATHFQLARNQVHFAELLDLEDITVAWGGDTLLEAVAQLMEKAAQADTAARLRRSAAFFVEPFDQPFSERIVAALEGMGNQAQEPQVCERIVRP